MRLNGIHAEPGTVIGVDFRTKNFLVVDENDQYEVTTFGDPEPKFINGRGMQLRFATEEESRPQAFKHEPRSVTEHRGTKRRMSVYGLIRQFHPTPTKAVKIEIPVAQPPRRVRRALERDGLIHTRSNVYPLSVRRDDGY